MQSTILNRDFYAGFCLLYLPFAMLMGIDAGRSRVPLLWHLIGMVASLMTIVSVFYCKSKGEYIFGVIGVVLFIGLFLKAGQLSRLRRRHVLAWIGGVVMLLGAVAWMQSPEMADQLKSVGVSVKSRSIIWEGSWKLFLSHPIFGGGPGSFRIYFPQFRNADYFLYEISNVTLYSHNYFLDLLSETGVLGFGCYMTMLGTLCVGGLWWAVKHQDPRLRGILVACFVSMVGIFGSNLSSPNARWVIGASSLWTVMGFFSGILHQANVPSAQVEASASLTSRRKQAASADFGWRPYVFGSLTFLSLIVAPVIGRHGVLYFQSALPYAKGYSSMTVAYDAVDKGSNNLSGIEDYLKDSAVQYEKSLKVVPSNVSASYKLGSVYTQLMRINQNRAAEYKQEKDAKTARHFQNVADHYLNKARETYEKVVCYWPEYAEIPYNFGIIYKFYADYLRRSAQDLEDQPEKPDLPAAKKGEHVASLLSQADVMEKNALKCLERMEEMSIKPEVALQLGRAYEEMGMLVRANEVYRAASHDNPDNKDLISRYYRSAYKLDQVSGMADAMELYCQLDMNQYQLINNLINLCLENDLNDPLDRLLSRIRARDPIDARLYEVGIMRAGKLADDEALLSALDQYLKVGGTSTSYIQMGVESARKIGLADKALYYEGLLRNAGVDTVTTPTVIQ